MKPPEFVTSPFLPGEDRQILMDKGIEQLEIWLYDVIKIGLLQYDFAEQSVFEISSRMIDAKLGGIARRLRRLGTLNRADPDWVEQVLRILGDLYLLVSAFKNKKELSSGLITSLYSLAGLNIKKTDLLSLAPVEDHWLVCGVEFEEEENLRSRFTWIMGAKSKRTALLLDFAFGRVDFQTRYLFRHSYQGSLYYYPGSFPIRAHLQDPLVVRKIKTFPASFENIEKYLDVYAHAISLNPWITDFPVCIRNVTLQKSGEKFLMVDSGGQVLPVKNSPDDLWPVYAALGLQSCSLFGIWDGKEIRILSWDDGFVHQSL
ncbi:MAG: hypothetical protein KDC80_10140 [Saprospiraceae bacterium]|nr:hypothetical protein [Saprospiraceae bacterium]